MTLKSMKFSEAELKKRTEPAESLVSDRPVYPYGLNVRLDEDTLDKLGIDTLPKVDGDLMLWARVKVVSVSSNEHTSNDSKGKHKHRMVELQITDMALDEAPKEKDAADELYAKA